MVESKFEISEEIINEFKEQNYFLLHSERGYNCIKYEDEQGDEDYALIVFTNFEAIQRYQKQYNANDTIIETNLGNAEKIAKSICVKRGALFYWETGNETDLFGFVL